MKSFDDFWKRLKSANPALQDDSTKMTMTVAAFKRQLQRAYQKGYQDFIDSSKEITGDEMPDFMRDILGKRFD